MAQHSTSRIQDYDAGLLKVAPATAEERFLAYKKELHQQLIAGMDLSAIGTMNEEELRFEVRRAAEQLCRLRSDLLSLSERERLVNEVLDETFGLGRWSL